MHSSRRTLPLALLTSLLAAHCGNGDGFLLDSGTRDAFVPPEDHAQPTDGALDAADAQPTDAAPDAAVDAVDAQDVAPALDAQDVVAHDAAPDVAAPGDAADASDAAAPDVVTAPSGRCTPTIDGTVASDWSSSAVVVTNTTATAWAGNSLGALHVCYDATNLYLGVEGTVEATNAIVVYIDRDYRGGAGGSATGISLLSALTDHTGNLDSHVSAALALGPGAAGFGAEGAWGTAGMNSLAATDTNDAVGLRLFWPAGGTAADGGTLPDRRGDFAWQAGVHTECRTTGLAPACEVAIAWTSLFEAPRPASTTVALFARINNGDGSMSSNQTLPADDPTSSRTINQLLVLPVAP